MKYKYLFLLNFSLWFLIGCKSIPMSTERTPNLLVGEITFISSDFVSSQGISFIGKTTSGIEIVIRNTATNEILRFPADKNGLFYVNLQEGEYWIDELHIKKERNDGSWTTLYTNPALKVVEVESRKVSNIGKIQWIYAERRHNVVQIDNSSDNQDVFSKQFPKSNWNQEEWKYEQLSFYAKKPSEPMYNEKNQTLLVGKVLFTGSKDISGTGMSYDGISSIEAVIRNTATNEILRFPADKNGLFYVNLQEGEYWIDQLHIKMERYDGTWSTFSTKPALKVLEVESGKVNNIGTLQWSPVDEYKKHYVIQTDNSSANKIEFSKQFPESYWNQKEWKYGELSFDVKKPSEPIYNEINPTLLVGEIVFTGRNYVSANGISFDGTATSGIEILVKNTATNEILRFPADKNGLFYVSLQEGKYWISEFFIKKEHYDGSGAYISTSASRPMVLEVERGKVNNIGTIQWSFIDLRHNIIREDNSSEIKNKFSKQFPESIWNTKEWIYRP